MPPVKKAAPAAKKAPAKKAAPAAKKAPAKKAAPAAKAPAQKSTTSSQKTLSEDHFEAAAVAAMDGTFLVTLDNPATDSHDVWYIPVGVSNLTSAKIRLEKEGVTLAEAMEHIVPLVAAEIAAADESDFPDKDDDGEVKVTKAKKAPAKKATPAKKAAAKKSA